MRKGVEILERSHSFVSSVDGMRCWERTLEGKVEPGRLRREFHKRKQSARKGVRILLRKIPLAPSSYRR
jgi:hypothetical protein